MLWPISAVLLVLLTVFWGIGAYSRLNGLRKAHAQAFSQIDVQIKQRHRAMHALVEKLNRIQGGESTSVESVEPVYQQAVEASKRLAANPSDFEAMHNLAADDSAFAAALGTCIAAAESRVVPADQDPTATESMRQLAEERCSLDNRIAFARQSYNQTVEHYNAALQQFPASLIASLFGFERAQPWQSNDAPIDRRQERRDE